MFNLLSRDYSYTFHMFDGSAVKGKFKSSNPSHDGTETWIKIELAGGVLSLIRESEVKYVTSAM